MITPQDFDLLSAYLDNALSPRDQAALIARLAQDSALRAALADLRLNRRLLRALPTLKPPRSFTLTPSQAQTLRRPRGFQLFSALRLATTFAALIFAFVLIADFGGGVFNRRGVASAPQAASVNPSEGAAGGASAESAAPPEASNLAQDTYATESETPLAKAGVMPATETPNVALFSAAPVTEAQVTVGNAAPQPTPEPAPQDETARSMEMVTETETPEVASAESATQVAFMPLVENPAPAPIAEPQPIALPSVRYIEIALAVLVVSLLVATWLARR